MHSCGCNYCDFRQRYDREIEREEEAEMKFLDLLDEDTDEGNILGLTLPTTKDTKDCC